jgi:crossover junction endodeoxyribonuclease RuvC
VNAEIRIVALDLSLAKTGVATLTYTNGTWDLDHYRVQTSPHGKGNTRGLRERMREIRSSCGIAAEHADLVLMEGPSFASVGSSSKDIMGLWWLVYDRLCDDVQSPVVVPPSTLKKWACGKGNAGKTQVAMGVFRTFDSKTFGVDFSNADDNEVDACALAGLGAQLYGLPVPFELPKYRTDVVSGLRLPEGEAA